MHGLGECCTKLRSAGLLQQERSCLTLNKTVCHNYSSPCFKCIAVMALKATVVPSFVPTVLRTTAITLCQHELGRCKIVTLHRNRCISNALTSCTATHNSSSSRAIHAHTNLAQFMGLLMSPSTMLDRHINNTAALFMYSMGLVKPTSKCQKDESH